eukprot:TRINITY_DN1983_c0_g1_i1.p1 TRINITY_DN1983_c0_g1~~TRINITY_DN1983_c0_g1_i1.p1  ORF type:complete len:256 (-),score=50.53 TRINITY_DN1983_c0_g1_i1:250-936(-)
MAAAVSVADSEVIVRTSTIEPTSPHTATVFFFHGRGDKGESWSSVLQFLKNLYPHAKVICPTAIVRDFGQYQMEGWYGQELDGLGDSVHYLHNLIDQEIGNGIDASRIIVGGFSQGAVLTASGVYSYPKEIGGAMVLAGYAPPLEDFPVPFNPESATTELFWGHGILDDRITFARGKDSYERLEKLGVKGKLHGYEGLKHSLSQQELQDMKTFFAKKIGKVSTQNQEL